MKRSKKYNEKSKLVDKDKNYSVEEAFELIKQVSYSKFDATVELAISLGVDPRHADQLVRGTVVLPNGTGKQPRILVLAQGEKEQEAKDAGADFAGSDDLIEKIKDGWVDFDVAIATPDMMREVGKIGRILGPKGLMPNPKLGTVTFDIAKAVEDVKRGKVEYRVDKYGIVHLAIGKISFSSEQLKENYFTIMDAIIKAKPSGAKGQYLKKIAISPTMGPSIKIDVNNALKKA